MRTREFIVEYDRSRERSRIAAAYEKRIKQDPGFRWEYLEELDPTTQKKYVPRLVQWWVNGADINDLEDRLDPTLYYYVQLGLKKKLKPEHQDLNKFPSLASFLKAMDQYDFEKLFQSDGRPRGKEKELLKTPDIRVVQMLDEENMQFWAQGTKWCTGGDSNYDFACDYSEGYLYVIIPGPELKKKLHKPTNAKFPEVKFQYWWNSPEFEIKNELNQPVSPEDIDVLRPYLIPVFGGKHKNILWDLEPDDKLISKALLSSEATNHIHHIKNLTDEKLIPLIPKNPVLVSYLKTPTLEILSALVEKEPQIVAAIKKPDPKLLIKAAQKDRSFLHWYKTSNEDVLKAAVEKNPQQIYMIKNPSDDVQVAAVSKDPRVIGYIKNPCPAAKQIAARKKSK